MSWYTRVQACNMAKQRLASMTQDVTNGWQTTSLKHLCIGDMSPPAYIKYLSLTPHVKSLQCLHVGSEEGPCFCTVEYLVKFLINCAILLYVLLLFFSPAVLLVYFLLFVSLLLAVHNVVVMIINVWTGPAHSLTHSCLVRDGVYFHQTFYDSAAIDGRRTANTAFNQLAIQPGTCCFRCTAASDDIWWRAAVAISVFDSTHRVISTIICRRISMIINSLPNVCPRSLA